MLQQIKETTSFLQSKTNLIPEVGIILGTGLGGLTKEIEISVAIPYNEIPHFPVSTVQGHSGKLLFGKLGGKNIVAMQGRFHFYEGYDMKQVTYPVRVMQALGIKNLMLSNAAGGTNPYFQIGEIMIIKDHINLFPTNPLIGKNEDQLGPRFPDMSEAYDKKQIAMAKEIASSNNIRVAEGVYAGLTGPCYETPSEYKYLQIIGADAVGMSTVPEVIVARHMGIPCFAVSIITDLGIDGKIVEVSHEEVQQVASEAEPRMTLIIKELLKRI
ncbi:MAG: purine-nucleoside phosphorylase [Flavobacteriales bacterium]|nr:purine-nucleoside phosphorylase [Flavobacteriales bacterium]